MSSPPSLASRVATALRTARQGRGLSIAQLASRGGVSPRLVSEFERGKRPHVSLDTALRLLQLVRIPLEVAAPSSEVDNAEARAERRRNTWVGQKTTLNAMAEPPAPASYAVRLSAVAQASRLAVGLQHAHRAAASAPSGMRATEKRAIVKRTTVKRPRAKHPTR